MRGLLNHWEINENVALQNINNIKNIVTSKFKEKMWYEKYLAAKIKLRYYKEVIDSTLEDQKYLYVLTSSKKKINIAKIRRNSHELHSEIGCWAVPKTPLQGAKDDKLFKSVLCHVNLGELSLDEMCSQFQK